MKTITSLYSLSTAAIALTALAAGCMTTPSQPASPPTAAAIFSPADGYTFPSPLSATLALNGLDGPELVGGTICATTDGSAPVLDGVGGCSAGSPVAGGELPLGCLTPNVSSATPVLENYTVNIVFGWDNGTDPASEENASASYNVDCTLYQIYQISGAGVVSGATTGATSYAGFARFNPHPDNGGFQYEFTTNSVTGLTNTTTVSQAGIGGLWADPTLSFIAGTSGVISCANNGGILNGCDNIVLNEFQAINFTAGDPITIPGLGGNILLSTTASQAGGAVTILSDLTFLRIQ